MLPTDCTTCIDTCCDTVFDACDSIGIVALQALEECETVDCCGAYERIVSVSEPHWLGSYVATWAAAIEPHPAPQAPNSKLLQFPQAKIRIAVKLMETGWPTIEAGYVTATIPDPAQITALARHSTAHGEAMYRGVMNHLARTNVCGDFIGSYPLQPVGPSGGMVGWRFEVVVALPWHSS